MAGDWIFSALKGIPKGFSPILRKRRENLKTIIMNTMIKVMIMEEMLLLTSKRPHNVAGKSPSLSPEQFVRDLKRSRAVARVWREGGWAVFQFKEGWEGFALEIYKTARLKGIKVRIGHTLFFGQPIIKVWLGSKKG